jgi:hypothetical protein
MVDPKTGEKTKSKWLEILELEWFMKMYWKLHE